MAYLIDAGIQVSLGKTALNTTTTDPAQMVWYRLTDHNRDPISINTEIIESAQRMANGKLRKYVIAQKNKISVSWKYVPALSFKIDPTTRLPLTGDANKLTVDGNLSSAWIESFYQTNSGLPIYLRIFSAGTDSNIATSVIDPNLNTPSNQKPVIGSLPPTTLGTSQNGFKLYSVYITDFSKTIINRTRLSDYVDMSIEFTEI